MAANGAGFARRMKLVESIVTRFGLKSKSIETVAYYADCSFDFNNFIYKVELESPALPSSFPGDQPGTVPAPPAGVSTLIVRLSNLRAEGLNNANRVANDVASTLIARQAIEKAGLEQIVPAVYAWAPAVSNDVIEEENFGWVVAEFKTGKDLDAQLPSLSADEKEDVLNHIAKIVAALQNAPVPATVNRFGGLAFDEQGNIVSAEMVLIKGDPFERYAQVWAAKLQAQLEESETNPVLNGWREQGIAERIRSFIETLGLGDAVAGVAPREYTFVHGDLTTNNMLYDASSKKITALLDFDWSSITHPAEEFFSGLRDIGGGVADVPKDVLAAILANDFSARPDHLTDEEITQWDAAKAWSLAAGRHGVRLPSAMAGIDKIKRLHAFSSAICPFQLSCEPMRRRLSDEAKEKKKKESVEAVVQFLEQHNF